MTKKVQPQHTPVHAEIDMDDLKGKFEDLLAPIEEVREKRSALWSRWVWETGSEEDRRKVDALDALIKKKEHIMGLFDKMVKPVGK